MAASGEDGDGGYCGEEVTGNREQQAVELETLLSIYSDEITLITAGTEFLVKVTPNVDVGIQLVLSPHNAFPSAQTSMPTSSTSLSAFTPLSHTSTAAARPPRISTVTHLPPLSLFVRYHLSYPSRSPPTLHLSARWLNNRLAMFAVKRMQQMFTAECLVVYDWINYLQNEFLSEYTERQHQQNSNVMASTDSVSSSSTGIASTSLACKPSAVNQESCAEANEMAREATDHVPQQHSSQIFLRSVSQFNDVEEFDRYECHREFLQSKHECAICFLMVAGEQFSEPCLACGEAFCKQCLISYCRTCIEDGRVSGLDCPTATCSQLLSLPLLEALLPPNLLQRYLHLHEEVQLDSIPGMVFCPRSMCGSRVVSEPDSDLAMCPECSFPFCKLCRQTWHGPGVCPSLSKMEALQQAEREGKEEGKKLKKKDEAEEKRKLEELKTLVWMRSNENVKPCPKCGAAIQKTGGCNKMACTKCSSFFCWICGRQIAGYSHFNSADCALFRIQDYAPVKETQDIHFPKNERAIENALMSECPRCQHMETKSSNNNRIFCGRCQFQYCHWCLEPCYGTWHFSNFGCKQFTSVEQDMQHFNRPTKEWQTQAPD